jgi:hypothetical protein
VYARQDTHSAEEFGASLVTPDQTGNPSGPIAVGVQFEKGNPISIGLPDNLGVSRHFLAFHTY